MPIHPEYRQLWIHAGYRSDMGSAIAVRPPSSELLRVYHLTTAEFALRDIEFGRLPRPRPEFRAITLDGYSVLSRASPTAQGDPPPVRVAVNWN